MTSGTELQDIILYLETSLLNAKRELSELEGKPWEPPGGIFTVMHDGSAALMISTPKCKHGGVEFNTEKHVEICAQLCKITRWLYHCQIDLCPGFKPDWGMGTQRKWFVDFDPVNSILEINSGCTFQNSIPIQFNTKENAKIAGERVLPLLLKLNEMLRN